MAHHHTSTPQGGVQSGVRWLLRAEGLALLVISCVAYAHLGSGWNWSWFFGLFLLPDVAFIGYAAGPRVGALCYNATHSTIGAFFLLAVSLFYIETGWGLALALIWLAHIGFDRMLGYGLKYTHGFGWTHLGRLGKNKPTKEN